MEIKGFYLLFYSLFFSSYASSQHLYSVKSIRDLVNFNCYIIKVKKVGEINDSNEICILSNYSKNGIFKKADSIRVGMVLPILNLAEISNSENPFETLIKLNRKGRQALYIDNNLVYDPRIKFYSSAEVRGLFYNVELK